MRESKALVPSAWLWAHGVKRRAIKFDEVNAGRYRSPDPCVRLAHRNVYRRLAPDSRKIDLAELAGSGLSERLLNAMGRDLGSVHASTGATKKILQDLDRRGSAWLEEASEVAMAHVRADFASVVKNTPLHTRASKAQP